MLILKEMRQIVILVLCVLPTWLQAQVPVDLKGFDKKKGPRPLLREISCWWNGRPAIRIRRVSIDLNKSQPLIGSLANWDKC
jgi:hypothetical protein